MFIWDDRILQNFCFGCLNQNGALQHFEIKIMMDVNQTILANTSPNYYVFWVIWRYLSQEISIYKSVLCIIQIRRFLECSEVPGLGMFKVS